MEIAICTMTKNQEKRLSEWILYHYSIGFNKFIFYLDNCTDNSNNVLINIRNEFLFDIDIYLTEDNKNIQSMHWINRSHYVYTETINNYNYIDWIAFIEVDEFIFPQNKNFSLHKYLKEINSKSLYINSWDYKPPPFDYDKPILKQSNQCWTDEERFMNGYKWRGKSVIQPKYFKCCMDAHHFMQKDGNISIEFKINRGLLQVYHGNEVYIDDNILRIGHFRNHTPYSNNYIIKNNIINLCIIGSGWYGCYIAEYLLDNYENINITIVEKNDDIFNESSLKNQNRLHLGFHYTLCEKTRNKCKKYFTYFLNKYKQFVKSFKNNYYLLSNNSQFKFDEYIKLYSLEDFNLIDNNLFENIYIKIINTKEMYIDFNGIKNYFKKKFDNRIKFILNYNVSEIKNKNGLVFIKSTNNQINVFNKVFNCTYNQLKNTDNIIYEKCLTLLYKQIDKIDFDCITVVDGDFCSLYYYNEINNNKIYTLTSVKYTPLIKSNDFKEVSTFTNYSISEKIKLFENDIKHYFPNFNEKFEYYDNYISYKCKNICDNNSRDINYNIDENIFNVWSGKISFIFDTNKNIDKFMI
jgi:hypothetical protein